MPYSKRVQELIPVSCGQPAGDRSHKPGGRLPLLSARPVITSPATEHHRPLAGTKLYCLLTEAHVRKRLAQGCTRYARRPGFEPMTYCSQVRLPNHSATEPQGACRPMRLYGRSRDSSSVCISDDDIAVSIKLQQPRWSSGG